MSIKRALLIPAVILLLLSASCAPTAGGPAESGPPAATTAPSGPPTATPPAGFPDAPPPAPDVTEYGEPAVIVDREFSYFSGYLRYPVTGHKAADAAISGWARETYGTARKELEELRRTDEAAYGELDVRYNSYLAPGGYAGIEARGYSRRSGGGEDVFTILTRTFNVDTVNGALLTNDMILDMEKVDAILALLRDEVSNRKTGLDKELGEVDASWLDSLVLTGEGVGARRGNWLFTLTYEALGDAYLLPSAPPDSSEPPGGPDATPPAFFPPPNVTAMPSRELDYTKPMLALTFDDGPSEETALILDILERYNARATFCVLGGRAAAYADTIKRAFDMGCEVAGHSWNHKDLTKLTEDEARAQLLDTNQAIYDATGYWPPYFRPPYGATNEALRNIAIELKLSQLFWSVDTRDWQSRDPDEICSVIARDAKNGSIILFHDIYPTTVEAMERAIPGLIDLGYQLVTVAELLGPPESLEPGRIYNRR